MTAGAAGCLVLVSTPIGNLGDLSPRARQVLAGADIVACEDTRHTGKLLELTGLHAERLLAVHSHNEAVRSQEIVEACLAGATVALVSDAGTPGVSDPGERIVAAAVAAGVTVRAVPGPSAVLCALVVSGLPTDRFVFEGFLPRKGPERRARLAAIAVSPVTTVCYEAPGRVAATLAELAEACGPDRRAAVSRELTKLYEETWHSTLGEVAARAAEAGEPRGEHVIVVGPAPVPSTPSAAELDEAVRRLLEAGVSAGDARRAAQVLLGASRSDAYDAVLHAAADSTDRRS